MRIPLGLVEKWFTFLALQLFAGALIPLIQEKRGVAADSAQGDVVTQLFLYIVFLVTILLLVARWKAFVRTAMRDKLLWLLVGIALFSVLWSITPDITLRRSFALLGTTLFGVYFATRYDLSEQLQLLAWTLGTGVVLSLLLTPVLPSYGIMSGEYAGAWRGIYSHKNILGRLMVLSALVFLLLSNGSRRQIWLARVAIGLSMILILLSNSKSALIILLTLLILVPFYRALQRHYTVGMFLLIVVVSVGGGMASLFVSNMETILGALGRDATLTGRTELWAAVLDRIGQRPWLGYGYKAFWLSQDREAASYVWNVTQWRPAHSHNGFLELGLDLGLVGLFVFVVGFLRAYFGGLVWIFSAKPGVGLWPLLYMTFILLANLTESMILRQNSIFWVLYVAAIYSMLVQPATVAKPEAFGKLSTKGTQSRKCLKSLP